MHITVRSTVKEVVLFLLNELSFTRVIWRKFRVLVRQIFVNDLVSSIPIVCVILNKVRFGANNCIVIAFIPGRSFDTWHIEEILLDLNASSNSLFNYIADA